MTDLRRELGIFSCTMLVAGNMIGIGIFITPGRIAGLLPDPKIILLAWVFGGLLSLAGALTYSELSSRFPRAGGSYVFLRESYGPLMGFLAGFSSSLVTLPGASAFMAIGVTKYAGFTDPFIAKTVAVTLILSISLINYWGVKWGAELQDGFMVVKFILIFILIAAGFLSGNGSFEHFSMTQAAERSLWVAIPLAMVPVMYTYSGWDATAYIAGEVKNPTKTILTSLLVGTLTVTLVYLALATLYIYAVPITAGKPDVRIVTATANVLFGAKIGSVIGWLIALSILGALSATILTAPRILYAMARDGLFPSVAGEVHPNFASPGKAIWLHAIGASILALSGTFDQLLDYVTVPHVLFAALAAAGLFTVRRRNLSDHGSVPYLTFGYPVIPILFILGMGWIVAVTAFKQPTDSLWGVFIVLLGIPTYYAWNWWTRKRAANPQ